jgi:hypothetical protein
MTDICLTDQHAVLSWHLFQTSDNCLKKSTHSLIAIKEGSKNCWQFKPGRKPFLTLGLGIKSHNTFDHSTRGQTSSLFPYDFRTKPKYNRNFESNRKSRPKISWIKISVTLFNCWDAKIINCTRHAYGWHFNFENALTK